MVNSSIDCLRKGEIEFELRVRGQTIPLQATYVTVLALLRAVILGPPIDVIFNREDSTRFLDEALDGCGELNVLIDELGHHPTSKQIFRLRSRIQHFLFRVEYLRKQGLMPEQIGALS